ncbi:hypothetical protein J6590_015111 [Homalodisca vitripennis]|nr:hypothetical protein J6590_015111 [Homalodisca vitripennis]
MTGEIFPYVTAMLQNAAEKSSGLESEIWGGGVEGSKRRRAGILNHDREHSTLRHGGGAPRRGEREICGRNVQTINDKPTAHDLQFSTAVPVHTRLG